MSNNNWYSSQSWYDPLYKETPPKAARGAKRRRLSFGWRLGIGITLLVGLIVLSSLLFAGPEPEPGAAFFYEEDMPENWMDYFDEYYTVTEGVPVEYRLENAENVPNFKLELKKTHGEELSLQQLYEKCAKATVSLKGYADGLDGYYWGTGIIISSDGLIVTNSHILEGCDSLTVVLHDDSEYEAKLVGADSTSDIAVLKIDGRGLPAAEFGDSAMLTVGDKVAAIGNPLAETFRMTLTDGIVSAIDRGLDYNGSKMTLIQTNTALNQGNSGGALFNIYGQVIGVTNMKMGSAYSSIEGIAFAIPSSTVKSVADSLIQYGEVRGRPSIGITVGAIPDDAAGHYDIPGGLYVSAVASGSDAEAKGIKKGDIVTAVNGSPVTTSDDIISVRETLIVGDSMTFTIWREGESFDVNVILVDTNDIY